MQSHWLEWAKELQALAQAGLHYTKDIYDKERFQRIREMSWQMLAQLNDQSLEDIQALFHTENGYQTPKVDTRAVVWEKEKILLVQEHDGRWALPGGWMDITETVSSNTEKELMEESGLIGEAQRIIAIQDHHRHNQVNQLFTIIKIFVECTVTSGKFQANSETIDMAFFNLNQLPVLNEGKTTYKQIDLCWRARQDPHFKVVFD